jgi:hypothetical protein
LILINVEVDGWLFFGGRKYASFRDERASKDLDGYFGLISIGADYVLNRLLLRYRVAAMSASPDRPQIDVGCRFRPVGVKQRRRYAPACGTRGTSVGRLPGSDVSTRAR